MRRKARKVKCALFPSAALLAALIGAACAPARAGEQGPVGTLAGGKILSWNLTLAGLLRSPFNLFPSDSVVYLQGSQIGATGNDVTFAYSGSGDGEAESEANPFDGNRACDPGGLCFGGNGPPENPFEAATRSSSDFEVIAPILPAVPEPATWALMLVGVVALGLVRAFTRKALTSK